MSVLNEVSLSCRALRLGCLVLGRLSVKCMCVTGMKCVGLLRNFTGVGLCGRLEKCLTFCMMWLIRAMPWLRPCGVRLTIVHSLVLPFELGLPLCLMLITLQ